MEIKDSPRSERKIFVALDFGSSLTKVACGRDSIEWQTFGIEPEIFPYDKNELFKISQGGKVLNALWVETLVGNGDAGQCYAIGNLANVVARTTRSLREPKHKSAVLKIMGVLAVIVDKFPGLSGKRLNCHMACVLPPGEANDKEELREALEEVLSEGFNSAAGFVQGKISYFDCKPEGGPLLLHYRKKRGMEEIEKRRITVLMTGFRNLSMLYLVKAVAERKITSELGYVRLLMGIKSKMTWLHNDEKLIEAISRYKEKLSLDRLGIDSVERFGDALKASQEVYHNEVRFWLKENVDPDTDLILVGGGAGRDLRPLFAEFFQAKEMYIYLSIIERDWDGKIKNEQAERYEDVLCLWEDLIDKHFKQKLTKNDEKKVIATKGNQN
jgi:hypothetical protein